MYSRMMYASELAAGMIGPQGYFRCTFRARLYIIEAAARVIFLSIFLEKEIRNGRRFVT